MKAVFTALLLLVPRVALACPICFGDSDSPMAVAMNRGIWLMLGITACVLGAFAAFFVYLVRRAHLADTSDGPAGAGTRGQSIPDAQGGTV